MAMKSSAKPWGLAGSNHKVACSKCRQVSYLHPGYARRSNGWECCYCGTVQGQR